LTLKIILITQILQTILFIISILIKSSLSVSGNLTKIIRLYQIFTNKDQIVSIFINQNQIETKNN